MRSKSYLTKLVLFGCIASILPVILLGTFSYVQSSQMVQEQANHGELQLVKQVNSNIEQVLMTVNHTLTNLAESTVMEEALMSPLLARDFKLYNDLRSEMSYLQAFDTKVEDVIIVNKKQDWISKNRGLSRLSEHGDRALYEAIFDLDFHTTWMLLKDSHFKDKISVQYDCEYTISLVKKLPIKRTVKDGLAFANISPCSFAEMIEYEQEAGEIMIVDEKRQIIVHHDPSMIGQYLSDTIDLKNVEQSFSGTSGQFRTTYKDRPYTVTYVKSNLNKWIYLSVVSIDQINKEASRIGWFTFFISLGIIVISVLFVWLTTRKLYSPVNNLVKYIEESDDETTYAKKNENEVQFIEEHVKKLFTSQSKLENEIKNHTEQIRSLFLNRLFIGSLRQAEIDEKLKQFGLDELSNNWRYMVVLTLQVDTLENTRYDAEDIELLLFAVSNIIEENIANIPHFPTVWFDHTLVMLIGFKEEDPSTIHDEVYQLTERLQGLIRTYLDLSVSIGISLPFDKVKKASRAYKEGIEALQHRLYLGTGVIIPFSNVNSGKHSIVYEYPERIELELIDAIKIADEEEMELYLERWFEKVFRKKQSPREHQISLMRLLNKLLIVKQEAGISFEQIGVQDDSLYEELLKIQVMDEIKEWFKRKLILPLIRVFQDRRDSQYHSLSEQIMDMIQKYYDTDLTLEECAAKLHYNANYLSSVIKKQTSYTFSEHLANYRFQMAKKWLVETEMTVKEIADKLKYNNSQNFIRSFKKQEGMTPGQYRSQYQR